MNKIQENIAKIEEGKIKGVNIGETNVIFKTKDGEKSVTAKIKVIDISDSDFLIFDESLREDTINNQISKIEPDTKTSDLLNKITYNKDSYDVVVKNINGEVISDDTLVGTGTTINLVTKDTKDIIRTYTVIIYGDVNGDGEISPSDYVKVKNNILGIESLNDLYKISGDVNNDEQISPSDYVKIKNKILGIEEIAQ